MELVGNAASLILRHKPTSAALVLYCQMLTLGIHSAVQYILRLSTAMCREPRAPPQFMRALSLGT